MVVPPFGRINFANTAIKSVSPLRINAISLMMSHFIATIRSGVNTLVYDQIRANVLTAFSFVFNANP